MTYKKFLIVASKLDKAGINITTQLSQFQDKSTADFDFYLVDNEIIYTENLDLEKFEGYDFIVFASQHKAKDESRKTLCVHAPGNFRNADFGGEKNKVCRTSSQFIKQFFENLHSCVEEHNLKDYEITLEATHHGPLISKPCAFVEIGPSETEWKDRRAAFVLTRALLHTLENFRINEYNENAIAIGGPHYCPNFNKIQKNSNVAISHVIPSYVFPVEEYMITEALEGTDEDVDLAVLDWKGLGNASHRERVLKILDKLHIDYRKTSDIGK